MKSERLTERVIDENGDEHIFTKYVKDNQKLKDKKLCYLEDIEDELGIDLVMLSKAIHNGVWVKDKEHGIHFLTLIDWVIEVSNIDGQLKPLFTFNVWEGNGEDADSTVYFIKDYDKTWALTKEELE